MVIEGPSCDAIGGAGSSSLLGALAHVVGQPRSWDNRECPRRKGLPRQSEADREQMRLPRANTIRAKLIAPCGMNCHLCRAYRRDKNVKPCPGCRHDDEGKPTTCASCLIKNCDELARDGLRYCFSCPRYPCARLRRLDKRYRTRYGMSMIANLENIRELGIRHFVREEAARWTCPECGDLISVHKPQCLSCGYPWRRDPIVMGG